MKYCQWCPRQVGVRNGARAFIAEILRWGTGADGRGLARRTSKEAQIVGGFSASVVARLVAASGLTVLTTVTS